MERIVKLSAERSPEYLAKREEVRLAEIELRNARERVAALRRELPKGAMINPVLTSFR